ncbi:MAG: dihydroorotate dehydrogenase electron transfer subunit [Candidatus Dormibacteraeota bacterium]|nr:dihydroorotate dehydrogenase electron transfer subunit [Candidatus Dormibacteraeota bacterium]
MSPVQLPESDLSRAHDETATCIAVDELGPDLHLLTLEAPAASRAALPGEFAQLQVAVGPLLRRPFSFCGVDPGQGTVSFYLRVYGEGTRRLAHLTPGSCLRLLGPLGRGFSLPETSGTSLLVAGGVGAAPFPHLAAQLLARGERVLWLNGAAGSAQLFPLRLMPGGLAGSVQVTFDGSSERRGLVTDALPELLAEVDRVYACGPNPMLQAVAETAARLQPEALVEVSIEAPMGCGFGTCLGCSIPLRLQGAPVPGLCCRQGPVVAADQINWEGLSRQPAHLE